MSIASAGAIVLTITTTVCNSFEQLAAHGSYVALFLSLLVSYSMIDDLKKNFVNYIFMSLVVFHLAKGGNLTLSSTEDAFLHGKAKTSLLSAAAAPSDPAPTHAIPGLVDTPWAPETTAEVAGGGYPEAAPEAGLLIDSNNFEVGTVYAENLIVAPPIQEYSRLEGLEIPMFAPMASEEGENDKEGGKKIFRQW